MTTGGRAMKIAGAAETGNRMLTFYLTPSDKTTKNQNMRRQSCAREELVAETKWFQKVPAFHPTLVETEIPQFTVLSVSTEIV